MFKDIERPTLAAAVHPAAAAVVLDLSQRQRLDGA